MRNHIKRLRIEKGLTQGELGQMVGMPSHFISRWELGTSDPSPALQQDIAIALGMTITRVFPDYVPYVPPEDVDRRRISTLESLRRAANVKVGDRMIIRISGGEKLPEDRYSVPIYTQGTVAQINPRWFRVVTDKGYSTCVLYQAFLSENDVRRLQE